MDMFTSYGHIIKLKENRKFFDGFRPGHVHLTVAVVMNNYEAERVHDTRL